MSPAARKSSRASPRPSAIRGRSPNWTCACDSSSFASAWTLSRGAGVARRTSVFASMRLLRLLEDGAGQLEGAERVLDDEGVPLLAGIEKGEAAGGVAVEGAEGGVQLLVALAGGGEQLFGQPLGALRPGGRSRRAGARGFGTRASFRRTRGRQAGSSLSRISSKASSSRTDVDQLGQLREAHVAEAAAGLEVAAALLEPLGLRPAARFSRSASLGWLAVTRRGIAASSSGTPERASRSSSTNSRSSRPSRPASTRRRSSSG